MTPLYSIGCPSPEYLLARPEPCRCVRHTPFSFATFPSLIESSSEYRWFIVEPPFVTHSSLAVFSRSDALKFGAFALSDEPPHPTAASVRANATRTMPRTAGFLPHTPLRSEFKSTLRG